MIEKRGIKQSYSTGPYNKFNDTEQWIRLTQGCPNHCPFCYEPPDQISFPIPEIVRNIVKIMEMNLLSFPDALEKIKILGNKRINNKFVYYQLVCGIDYRFLDQTIANALKDNHFVSIRLAWDWNFSDHFKIHDAIVKLRKAGYNSKDIMIFMICNWEISFSECCRKLNLCKYWNVQVADCYFDGQTSPNIEKKKKKKEEIKSFRKQVRKHNQFCNFHVDPEFNKQKRIKKIPIHKSKPFSFDD